MLKQLLDYFYAPHSFVGFNFQNLGSCLIYDGVSSEISYISNSVNLYTNSA